MTRGRPTGPEASDEDDDAARSAVLRLMSPVIEELARGLIDRERFVNAVRDLATAIDHLADDFSQRELVPRDFVADVFSLPYLLLMKTRGWEGEDLHVVVEAADRLDEALVGLFGRGVPYEPE